MSEVLEIKEAVSPNILKLPGVLGIGISRSSPETIRIYIKSECPKILGNIPAEIAGVPVKCVNTGGGVRAATINPRSKSRPAYPGMSIMHYSEFAAGTFGAVCYDNTTGEPLILSNNHVIGKSSTIQLPAGRIGDGIYQPGRLDGGTQADLIGYLHRIALMDELGANEVDGALAKPINDEDISDEILNIGRVRDVVGPRLGDAVHKMGRTTGYTEGFIDDVNADVTVEYGVPPNTKRILFKNLIVISKFQFARGGDSGSLLVKKNGNKAVGLVFAGSLNEEITFCNRMTLVASALNINLGGTVLEDDPGTSSGLVWGTAVLAGVPLLMWMKRDKKDTRRWK